MGSRQYFSTNVLEIQEGSAEFTRKFPLFAPPRSSDKLRVNSTNGEIVAGRDDEHWSYFDTNHPKLGWLRLFRNLDLLRGAQYTVRYRLNAAK